MRPLTPKQERFCAEYLVDLNATQAAIRAKYSARTARAAAGQLMANLEVQARIAELQRERAERVQFTADEVLMELAKVGRQDDVSSAVKVRALELIGKHLGMFVERHEHRVTMTAEERAARVAALLKKGGAGV